MKKTRAQSNLRKRLRNQKNDRKACRTIGSPVETFSPHRSRPRNWDQLGVIDKVLISEVKRPAA